MPLQINGYSTQFQTFVDFAQQEVQSKHGKTILRASGGTTALGDRSIMAADKADKDGVGGFSSWFRSDANKKANNAVRDLFRQTVIDMFGGESHIPDPVKDAMLMKDFGKGKPLTARRIMAVKAAIDDWNGINFFADDNACATARGLGYTETEMRKINICANICMRGTGCSQADALQKVMTPGTKENRLMQYGGRFLQSDKAFVQGLKLLDKFQQWYTDTKAQVDNNDRKSPTAINAHTNPFFTQNNAGGFERFVFEELALNPNIKLSGSPEEVFGVKNNPATRFVASNLYKSQTATMLQIPPEKRGVVFDAFACMMPQVPKGVRPKFTNNHTLMTARILRHFAAVENLRNTGNLTPQTLFATCFSELPQPQNPGLDALDDIAVDFFTRAQAAVGADSIGAILSILNDTGCTFEEAVHSFRTGEGIDKPNYMASYSSELSSFGTSTAGGLHAMTIDFPRADGYATDDGRQLPNPHFTVTFPQPIGETVNLVNTGNSVVRENQAQNVHDKIVRLCGNAHTRQATSVMFGLAQSSLLPLRGGLEGVGVHSSEHSAVDFSLERDDNTGAITIHYQSPQGCPVNFHWTATVDVNGFVTTTPIQVQVPQAD